MEGETYQHLGIQRIDNCHISAIAEIRTTILVGYIKALDVTADMLLSLFPNAIALEA